MCYSRISKTLSETGERGRRQREVLVRTREENRIFFNLERDKNFAKKKKKKKGKRNETEKTQAYRIVCDMTRRL